MAVRMMRALCALPADELTLTTLICYEGALAFEIDLFVMEELSVFLVTLKLHVILIHPLAISVSVSLLGYCKACTGGTEILGCL